jgi:hypothetical protein
VAAAAAAAERSTLGRRRFPSPPRGVEVWSGGRVVVVVVVVVVGVGGRGGGQTLVFNGAGVRRARWNGNPGCARRSLLALAGRVRVGLVVSSCSVS